MTRAAFPRRHKLVLTLVALTWACDGVSEHNAQRSSIVQVDLAALRARYSLSTAAAVLDSVALDVASPGLNRSYGAKLSVTGQIAPFRVTVNAGMVTFNAAVLSNNRTVLFAGTVTTDIQNHNFRVEVPLRVVAPILVVEPDSLQLAVDQAVTLTIRNAGLGTLTWNISNLPSGAFVTPTTGSTTTTPSQARVLVSANAPTRFSFNVNSNVGTKPVVVNIVRRGAP